MQAFPISAVTSRLDPQTRLKWKEHIQGNTSPTMEELFEFLHCREKVLETNRLPTKIDRSERNVSRSDNQNRNHNNRQSNYQVNSNRPAVTYAAMKPFCYICKGAHFMQSCIKLVKANLSERFNIVKNLNLCLNCLRSNHSVEKRNASMCKTCKKRHHTLLHRDDDVKMSAQVNLASLHSTTPSQVLLSTAIIHILDREGNPQNCRALLDNGSQVHFITEKIEKKLGLRQRELEIPLGGVNQMSSSANKITNTTVQSRLNKYSACLTFLITPEINEYTPSEPISRVALKIPSNINLADPEFHISTCNLSLNLLHNRISEFWEIENGPHDKTLSNEENECEEHYIKNTSRNPKSGRYIVKLPF